MNVNLTISLIFNRSKNLWKSSTVRTVFSLASGNLVATVLALVGSLVQAHFVTPDDLGYFRSFSILTGYFFLLHLGTFEAHQRLYPYYIGKGDQQRAINIAEVCQSWNLSVSMIVSSAFIVLAIASLSSGNWRATLGWLVQIVSITSILYGGFLNSTYRSGHDFVSVAKSLVIANIVNLFALPIFLISPYIALITKGGLGSIVNLTILHAHRPLHLKWRFSWGEWFGLVKEGMPIFIASYGAITLWSVVENTIVLHYLGTNALGFWAFSFSILDAANKMGQAIVAVYIPRLAELYGRTNSISRCVQIMKRPIVYGTLGTLVIMAMGWISLPLFIPIIMPNFTGAIYIAKFMLFVIPLTVLELPFWLLVAMKKTLWQNMAVYIGLGLFVVVAIVTMYLGLGLNGVLVASLLGRFVRILLTYVFILIARHEEVEMVI